MKDAIFSLEGRSALGGSTAFQVIRRGCTCTVVSTQWPRHDKSPSGKPPWQGLWGPVGKPSPRIWSPFPWGLITIAALICSRLPTSGTVHQRKSIPETLETPKGEGTGVPLAHRHPAGECVGVSGRGLSQREPWASTGVTDLIPTGAREVKEVGEVSQGRGGSKSMSPALRGLEDRGLWFCGTVGLVSPDLASFSEKLEIWSILLNCPTLKCTKKNPMSQMKYVCGLPSCDTCFRTSPPGV